MQAGPPLAQSLQNGWKVEGTGTKSFRGKDGPKSTVALLNRHGINLVNTTHPHTTFIREQSKKLSVRVIARRA